MGNKFKESISDSSFKFTVDTLVHMVRQVELILKPIIGTTQQTGLTFKNKTPLY